MRRDIEITAGVPGLGLSGLFVLLSALTLPLARPDGRQHGPRARIGRLFGMALVMAGAIILTWQAIVAAVTVLHAGGHPGSVGSAALTGHGLLRLPVIAISASIMALLIATAEALLHLIGMQPTPTPPPITPALPAETPPSDSQPTLRFRMHHRPDPAHTPHWTVLDDAPIPPRTNGVHRVGITQHPSGPSSPVIESRGHELRRSNADTDKRF